MDKLPLSDMVDRRVYRVRSRNLVVGAWRASTQGFIGIREKFGHLYLFEEYHYDTGGSVGTAHAVEDLGLDVPEDVPLEEYLRDGDDARTNQALFDLLRPFDEEINRQLREEFEREMQEAESKKWAPPTREEWERDQRVEAVKAWYRAQSDRFSSDVFKEFQRRLKEAYNPEAQGG